MRVVWRWSCPQIPPSHARVRRIWATRAVWKQGVRYFSLDAMLHRYSVVWDITGSVCLYTSHLFNSSFILPSSSPCPSLPLTSFSITLLLSTPLPLTITILLPPLPLPPPTTCTGTGQATSIQTTHGSLFVHVPDGNLSIVSSRCQDVGLLVAQTEYIVLVYACSPILWDNIIKLMCIPAGRFKVQF